MKIYTKTGDDGTTGLFGGKRVSKTNSRIEAYGTVDELNSFLGLALLNLKSDDIKNTILKIQNELFKIGAQLATPPEDSNKLKSTDLISDDDIIFLEKKIDEYDAQLSPLKSFILPGGSIGSSYLHVARTICRRCERRIIAIDLKENIDEIFIRYFNRLSDFLFVAARYENKISNTEDIIWNK